VKALTEPGHEYRAYTLTGSEALSYSESAERLSVALGRKAQFVNIRPEVARQNLVNAGLSPEVVESYINYTWYNAHDYGSVVTGWVERILGRKPITFDQFARDYVPAFTQAKAA